MARDKPSHVRPHALGRIWIVQAAMLATVKCLTGPPTQPTHRPAGARLLDALRETLLAEPGRDAADAGLERRPAPPTGCTSAFHAAAAADDGACCQLSHTCGWSTAAAAEVEAGDALRGAK